MGPIWELTARIASLFRNKNLENELGEELQYHLEMTVEENIRKGMTQKEARSAARRQFGGIDQAKEHYRKQRGIFVIETFLQDLKYGARVLKKNPGFAAIAILSLALGIGANTALFQLFNTISLQALPVVKPQELFIVGVTDKRKSGDFSSRWPLMTSAQWEQAQSGQQVFSDIAAWGDGTYNISQGGESRYAKTLFVSGNFFQTLGVKPIAGRTLGADDDRPGCAASGAVISYSFWQREFGGSPSAIGKPISLAGHSFDVIGITPDSFYGVEVGQNFDAAVPICAEGVLGAGRQNRLTHKYAWWLAGIARLKPGITPEQATAQLEAISPAIFKETLPANYAPDTAKNYLTFKLSLRPAGNGVSKVRNGYLQPLFVLMAISGMVLLIACANLANLLIARANAREREIATRLALGASRGRLIRQLLSESMLLAVVGTILGVVISQWLSRFLVASISTNSEQVFVNLSPDLKVLGFIVGLSVLTCLLFGLAPAIRASSSAIKAVGRGTTASREKQGLRRVLVISQVAMSLVLFIGALLFIRTMHNLSTQNVGFDKSGISVARIDFAGARIAAKANQQFKNELLDRLRGIPGVESAANSHMIPLDDSDWWNEKAIVEDRKATTNINTIGPGYFKTLGLPIVAGRDFDDRDDTKSAPVAIVNEAFSRRFFNGSNPISKTFRFEAGPTEPDRAFEIIGLTKDIKYDDLRVEFMPMVFFPSSQSPDPNTSTTVLIHSNLPTSALLQSIKTAVTEINPTITLNFRTLDNNVAEAMLLEGLMAKLSGFFGILAALLATLGLYGVMSYTVTQRKNEIGIRMALGATRVRIVAMILREAGLLVFIGLAIGTVATTFVAKTASSMLFGLQPDDVTTYAIGIAMLALIGILAGFVPAQRASNVDPMTALRNE